MALMKFKAEERKVNNYKEGTYLASIQSISDGVSRNGFEYIRVQFRGDEFGVISLSMYDTAYGRADLYKLYTAVGIDPSREDIDSDELLDSYVMIEIAKETRDDGTEYFSVVDIFSADTDDTEDDDIEYVF